MTTARVSDKGQVTLPAAMRRTLGILPHSKVEVEVRGDEIVLRPARSIMELAGVFRDQARRAPGDADAARAHAEAAVARQVADE